MDREQTNPMIKVENLIFEYSKEEDGKIIRAVDGVTLEIEEGSFTTVIGKNGSGKSTLAKNMNALLLPSGGAVYVDGYDTVKEENLWDIRQRVGMVFQNPDNQLVSAIVEDDVAFGPENMGTPPDEIRARVKDALEAVGMYDERKKAPHLLSGGQKQRIAIAGVIAMKPKYIVFDEPTAMLDPHGRSEVMNIIAKLNEEGITVVLITHFMEETVKSDRLVVMDQGHVVLDGAPKDIYKQTEELERLNLEIPLAVNMGNRLRARGYGIPDAIIEMEEMVEFLCRLK